MRNIIINQPLALEVGIKKSILLEYFRQRVINAEETETGLHGEDNWIKIDQENLYVHFPIMRSRENCEQFINELEEDGWLKADEFNQNPFDHTKWYTLDEKYLDWIEKNDPNYYPPVEEVPDKEDKMEKRTYGCKRNFIKPKAPKRIRLSAEKIAELKKIVHYWNNYEGESITNETVVPGYPLFQQCVGFSNLLQKRYKETRKKYEYSDFVEAIDRYAEDICAMVGKKEHNGMHSRRVSFINFISMPNPVMNKYINNL
jgi:hypothetical protein